MSAGALRGRLAALERRVGARAGVPSATAMQAAMTRTAARARARIEAVLAGRAVPTVDEAQAAADADTVARYCSAHRITLDADQSRATIMERLARLAAAGPPQGGASRV